MKRAIPIIKIGINEIISFRLEYLLEITNDVPKQTQKVAGTWDSKNEFEYSEGVDDGNLSVYAGLVFQSFTLVLNLVSLLVVPYFLLELVVEDGFDILFKLTCAQQIVTFWYSHNLYGIKQSTQVTRCCEKLGKGDDCYGVVHESV